MIDVIQNIAEEKKKQNHSSIEKELNNSIKRFIDDSHKVLIPLGFDSDFSEKTIEAALASVILATNITNDSYKIYSGIIEKYTIPLSFSTFEGLKKFQEEKDYGVAVKKLAGLSVKAIKKIGNNELAQLIQTIMVDFAILIGDTSRRVILAIADVSIDENDIKNQVASTNTAKVAFQQNDDKVFPNSSSKATPIIIVDSGITIKTDDQYNNYYCFGAILENKNNDCMAKRVSVRLQLLDSKGFVIAEDYSTINLIKPNERINFGISRYGISSAIRGYNIIVDCQFFDYFLDPYELSNKVEYLVSNPTKEYSRLVYLINVKNNCSKRPINVLSFSIIKDENNRIIGGTSTYNNNIKLGETSVSSFNYPLDIKISKIEVSCIEE